MKVAFFAASLSQHQERFLTCVLLTEHQHQYSQLLSAHFSLRKGCTATAVPAILQALFDLARVQPFFVAS